MQFGFRSITPYGIEAGSARFGGGPGAIPITSGLASSSVLAESAVSYAFTVGAKPRGGYEVQREECRVVRYDGSEHHFYSVERGRVTESTVSPSPVAADDRLYLVNVSGVEAFRPVYDALVSMGFYNLNPEAIRELQSPDPGDLLKRDGGNIASVLANLRTRSPAIKERVEEYLGKVVSGISGVDARSVGPKETLEFRQEVRGARYPWRFFASSMSDGTLRALGVLIALFQGFDGKESARRCVGIEEPEVALHPAAAGVLIDGLQDAAEQAQILVTSHSPDLLDNKEIPDDAIIAVVAEHGESRIGPLDEVGRSALRDHLYTAGELLRMNQLRPDPSVFELRPEQLHLFHSLP